MTFKDGFEKHKLHHFFHPLRNAKLRLGKCKHAVHLIAMMGIIMLHIREVDACMGEVAAHAQVERIDEHLVAKTTGHFYETHRLYSSELSRIWCRHFEQRCRHFFGMQTRESKLRPTLQKVKKEKIFCEIYPFAIRAFRAATILSKHVSTSKPRI